MEQDRLIQVFLSPTASPGPCIFEVTSNNGKLLCTCPGFSGRSSCKHTRFVKARIESNGGTYPLEILTKVTEEDKIIAESSPENFREFVIKFAKIEVF